MGKYYKNLKEKVKNEIQNEHYTDLLSNIVSAMFDYSGGYDGFFARQVELSFIGVGAVMTTKIDDEICTIPCNPVGLPNDNGKYEEWIGYTLNGKVANRKDGIDCVVGYNNNLGEPDNMIDFFADMLSEVDLSMRYNVLYSRNLPIPIAKDPKTRTALENAIGGMKTGKMEVILDQNIISELEGSKGIDILNISDVTNADKLQYLSMFHSDLFRRIMTLYGHNLNSTSKMAQQSVDEINGTESLSWIIPIDKLKQRKEWVDKVNEMFGAEFEEPLSVDFSPTWKIQFVAFGNNEDSSQEPIEEPENEPIEEPKKEPEEEKKEGEE